VILSHYPYVPSSVLRSYVIDDFGHKFQMTSPGMVQMFGIDPDHEFLVPSNVLQHALRDLSDE
jgi:hypothetical protein